MTTEMNSKSIIYLTYKFHRDGPTAAFNIQLEIVLWSQSQFCCAPHDGESPHVYILKYIKNHKSRNRDFNDIFYILKYIKIDAQECIAAIFDTIQFYHALEHVEDS